MKAKPLPSFSFKLLRPCRKLFLNLLRLPFARQTCIKPFKCMFKKRRGTARRRRARFISLRSALGLRRVTQDMETLSEAKSSGEPCRAPFSSPLTPSYVKLAAARGCAGEEVEEACRSFERHLVEMVVEGGEVGDLMDVEELLHCWNGLKSTVFIELVSSFYGEICRDLFSRKVEDD